MKIRQMLLLGFGFFLSGQMISSKCYAGFRVGNGGDHVRASFIRMGEAVIDYLADTTAGQDVVTRAKLSIDQLKATLDIEKITVVDDVLRDNSGSIVDALGEPGLIKLSKEAWFQHFEKQRDVYYLVFHEILRSAEINDDNYVISNALFEFPQSLRVDTKVVPILPLIDEDNLANVFDLKKVAVGGTGCSRNNNILAEILKLEFDQEKNILEVIPSAYRNEVNPQRGFDIKSCQISIPVTLPPRKRLVISQIDLIGKVDLEAGSQAKLTFEAFLAGSSSIQKSRVLNPNAPLFGRVLTRRTEILKSKCGGSDLVRMNTNIMTKGSQKRIESFSLGSLSLFLSLEDCR